MNTFSLKKLFFFEKTPLNLLVAIITVGLVAAFFAGVANYILHGHHAYNVTRQHPWGLLISMYVFFVFQVRVCVLSLRLVMFLASKSFNKSVSVRLQERLLPSLQVLLLSLLKSDILLRWLFTTF